jgi:hypothetical protein
MNNPVIIYRTLRTLAQQRLIGDKLLTGTRRPDRLRLGCVRRLRGDLPPRAAEKVKPLGEYPLTDDDPGTPALALTDKWGLSTRIPQELIARNRMDVVRARCASSSTRWCSGSTPSACPRSARRDPDPGGLGHVGHHGHRRPVPGHDAGGRRAGQPEPGLQRRRDRAVAGVLRAGRGHRQGAAERTARGQRQHRGHREHDPAGRPDLPEVDQPARRRERDGARLDRARARSPPSASAAPAGWVHPTATTSRSRSIPLDENDGFRIFCRKVAVPMVQEPGAAAKLTGA